MKYLFFTFLATVVTVLVFQVTADDVAISDKVTSYLSSLQKDYQEEIDSVRKTVDKIKEKASETLNDKNFDINSKIDDIMSAIRDKRSPQTYPESAKNPTDDLLAPVQKAYKDLTDKVSNFFGNVSNSEVGSDIKSHLDKFKNTLQDAGTHIKSTIHNLTSPATDDSKESKESN